MYIFVHIHKHVGSASNKEQPIQFKLSISRHISVFIKDCFSLPFLLPFQVQWFLLPRFMPETCQTNKVLPITSYKSMVYFSIQYEAVEKS